MKKLLPVKVIFLIVFFLIACNSELIKASSGYFNFQIDDKWEIKGWLDYSGSLLITEKINSNSYMGLISIVYVQNDVLAGEKINKAFETVKISIKERKIEITGEKIEGDENWIADTFSLEVTNNKLLEGNSKDLKGNFVKGISFVKNINEGYITSDKIIGKWYLSEKNSKDLSEKKFLLTNLKVSFLKGNTFNIKGESVQKDLLMTFTYEGRWKTDRNYLLVVLSNIHSKMDLNYQNPVIKKMSPYQIQVLKMKLKPKMDHSVRNMKSIFTKKVMEKQGVFKISETSDTRITIQKGDEKFVFHKQM
ncbi:MAG: hypothetical protein GY714_02570 [Desulfobacterales bacterium]|nr:hypothetical protein [Desulfobacterales bacterium]